MGILFQFLRDMRQWEPSVRWSFVLALGLLIALLAVIFVGGDRVPTWSWIGVVVLVFVLQAIVLYGNRHLVTPYTQAQRAFRAGDFERARAVLEQHIADQARAGKNVHADVYILLGNTLRNLGQLDESEAVLRRVIQQQPDYGFALYGLGRTLLVKGEYSEAAKIIKKSIRFGAPKAVSFELGYATLESGDVETGREILFESLGHVNEPYRKLMAYYLLGDLPTLLIPTPKSLVPGLGYWEREAEVFAATPYGRRVAEHVREIRAILDQLKLTGRL